VTNEASGTITKTSGGESTVGVVLDNAGTINVDAAGSMRISFLTNQSGTTLTGGTYIAAGTLRIDGSGVSTLAASIELIGTGVVQKAPANTDALAGLATVTPGGSLTLSSGKVQSVSGAVDNSGSVLIGSASRLELAAGDFTQDAGTTNLLAGSSELRVIGGADRAIFNGGILGGFGTVHASEVRNDATVSPGSGATGVLTVDGSYVQTAAGIFLADLDGTTPGTGHDQIAVTGAASLDGALALTTGPLPAVGDNFAVVAAGSRSGTFATVTGRQPGGTVVYRVAYSATSAVVETHPKPVLSVTDSSTTEGDVGSHDLVFTVTLTPTSPDTTLPDTVTVDYATSDGTATSPSDYDATNGTLTFLPGEDSKQVLVSVHGNFLVEPDEQLTLTLSNPDFAIVGSATAAGTIVNDDFDVTPPTVTIVTPPDGATYVQGAAVPADYSCSDESGGSGVASCSGPVADGAAIDTATIGSHSFSVTATDNAGNPQTVTHTYTVNPLPDSVSVGDASVLEGGSGTRKLVFPVTLSHASTVPVSVQYSVAGVSATGGTTGAGIDFKNVSGTVTFAPPAGGESPVVKTVSVTVYGDAVVEPDESLVVTLSSPTGGYTIGKAVGTGAILNDDTTVGLAVGVGDVTLVEGDAGTRKVTVSVTLTGAPGATTVTVPYTITGASWGKTIASGGDYGGATAGTLTFTGNAVTKTISVSVYGDTTNEGDETVTVSLGAPTGASTLRATGTLTIINDD
jgi:chitinase